MRLLDALRRRDDALPRCERCGRVIVLGGDCLAGGIVHAGEDPCRDCGVKVGGRHHHDCLEARCPVCDEQAVMCDGHG
jgi:hypothetical protein